MTIKTIARAGALLLCTTALASLSTAPLKAQSTRVGVDVRVSAEGVTNPRLGPDGGGLTAAANVEIRPFLETNSDSSSFRLEAFANAREFASDFDGEDRYGASAAFATRLSPRVELFANAGIQSTNVGIGSALSQPGTLVTDPTITDPTLVAVPIDPALGNDITLIGANGRTTAINAGVGAEIRLTDRLSLGLDAGYQDVSLSQFVDQDYTSINSEAALSYRLDDKTTIGVFGGYRDTNFDNPGLADARTWTGAGTLSRRLSDSLTLDLTAGLASTVIESLPLTPGRTFNSFTARAGLCNRTPQRNFCLSYSRSPVATAFGGVQNSDAIGFSYSQPLSDRDSITVGANYTRTGGALTTAVPINTLASQGPVELANVTTSYNRRINDRLEGFVFGSVSRLYNDLIESDPSINFGVGLRLRIGSRR
jgi:hypothetical protein